VNRISGFNIFTDISGHFLWLFSQNRTTIEYNCDDFCEDKFHPTKQVTETCMPHVTPGLLKKRIPVVRNGRAVLNTPSPKLENTKKPQDEY
jgi:hypothetical protein